MGIVPYFPLIKNTDFWKGTGTVRYTTRPECPAKYPVQGIARGT